MLTQLAGLLGQISLAEYVRPLPVLSGNTLGKHVRHILEFYELLVDGAQSGRLNYDWRRRDLRLEEDTDEALRRIGTIDRAIHRLDLNRSLRLETALAVAGEGLTSTLARELLYNIEHGIHHMALIRVAVQVHFPAVALPAHFGVAYGTIQYQRQTQAETAH